MTDDAGRQRTADLFRGQAAACGALGSPLYGDLLQHVADDVLTGGPVLRVIGGHLADSGPSALALRLMAGAHALVLTGQAPELAAYYPSAGGEADPSPGATAAWAALRSLFETSGDSIATWLTRPPQTNEVGRGAALIGGLCHLVASSDLPIRLIEIGASAGLNLRADRFHISSGNGFGDAASPVQLGDAWQGSQPRSRELVIVKRSGGDLTPIDPTTDQGRLSLQAYVWPDQRDRIARLRGALALAAQIPAELRRESALTTVNDLALADDTWTVVWHSVFWQYLDADEKQDVEARLAELGRAATERSRLAHLSLEPRRRTPDSPHEFLVTMTTWPGGEYRVLGTAAPHGVPVSWE